MRHYERREPHPSPHIDERSKPYPTAQREVKPRSYKAHPEADQTQERIMANFTQHDINVLEGEEPSDEMEQALSLQRAINQGLWGLQGSYGRTMMAAIETGRCMLGTSDAHDYYGNHIPSRTQVQEGTKGSRGWVVIHMGEQWAKALEGA